MSEILVNEKNIVFSIKVMYNLIKTNGNNNIKQMNKKNNKNDEKKKSVKTVNGYDAEEKVLV